MEEFVEETEIDERAIRRLASAKGFTVTKSEDSWMCCGVSMSDDEVWACLSNV